VLLGFFIMTASPAIALATLIRERKAELINVRSPDDFRNKILLWMRIPTKERLWAFSLIKWDNMYGLICEERGYDLHHSWMATELLKFALKNL
jgi:hypothetical protein